MTREEAIKKVRWGLLGLVIDKDVRDAFETLIPELAESEDERIRKEMIDFIQWAEDRGMTRHDYHQAKRPAVWIAYLEKQKEQKHYWKPTKTDVALLNKAVTTNKAITPAERAQLDIIRSKFGCCRAPNCGGIVRKEQKPEDRFEEAREKYQVEWSRQDEKMLEDTIRSFQLAYPYALEDENPRKKNIEWLKSLPKRFNIQPKQEWSEEDEKMRNLIVAIFEVNHPDGFFKANELGTTDMRGVYTEEIISWLKSLRPQPKAELTLLDENIIEAAVAFVKQNDHFNCWGGIDKHTVIKALHSLKPHWKPSEEQMEALEYVIRDYREDSCNATANYLQEILDHLKNM